MFLHSAMRYYRLWIYCCNAALLVSAAAFASLAAWLLSDFRAALLVPWMRHQPSMVYACVALALQGGVLQAVGCAGALRLSERLLRAYWALLLLLLVGDAALGAFWLARFRILADGLRDELRGRLLHPDAEFRLLWERLQSEAHCCGVSGPADFENAGGGWLARPRQRVPRSCCPSNTTCVEDMSLAYAKGCHETLLRWLRRAAHLLSVLGFCVLAFLKLCFVAILRCEIREMLHKIRMMREARDSPGLLDPTGPAQLLPGIKHNGNNNDPV